MGRTRSNACKQNGVEKENVTKTALAPNLRTPSTVASIDGQRADGRKGGKGRLTKRCEETKVGKGGAKKRGGKGEKGEKGGKGKKEACASSNHGWESRTLYESDRNRVEVWRRGSFAPFVSKAFGKVEEAMEELRVLYMLDRHPHPHLLHAIHPPSFVSGFMVVYLPMCEGGDLFDFVKSRGHLPEPEAYSLLLQIVSGVAHLHRHNVVHLDIKLENVLCNADHTVAKVADFGHSQMVCTPDFQCTVRHGTHLYAAPEVHDDHPLYDGRLADAWSIGVAAFLMTFGRNPFPDDYVRRSRSSPSTPPICDAALLQYNTTPRMSDFIQSCVVTDPSLRASPFLLELAHCSGA